MRREMQGLAGGVAVVRTWTLKVWAFLVLCVGLVAGAYAAETFLEPEQAFRSDVRADGPQRLIWSIQVAPGYYLYRDRLSATSESGADAVQIEVPRGQVKFDETFQKDVETLRGELRIPVAVRSSAAEVALQLGFQGCADAGLCYPPQTQSWQVQLAGPNGTVEARRTDGPIVSAGAGGGLSERFAVPPLARTADASGVGLVLSAGSWWAAVGGFLVMGALLSLTPCVLPMVPILSAILAGGGPVSRWRGFALASAYTFGMATVYTALGIAAGLAGEGLAAWLQTPWMISAFAGLLVLFSLAMFDVYELRLPHALSGRLDEGARRLPGGRLFGVFLMGGLSALVVSPCVSAPLAGALVFLSQTGDVWLAGSALFALALGMSVPLLLLGMTSGHWLPKSGAWMHAIKRFFGLLLLGVALWMIQPLIPGPVALLAWAALALTTGFMLRPFDSHPHSGAPRVSLQRALGMGLLAWGVLLLAGAAAGGRDPLQPLTVIGRAAIAATDAASPPAFQPVRSVAELEQALKSAGRPVMLDFYADWCVSCKEMERLTFADPGIATKLRTALLLRADVTANSEVDRALLRRFQLFGPPATLFFDSSGQELVGTRVVGFQNSELFAKSLQRAGL